MRKREGKRYQPQRPDLNKDEKPITMKEKYKFCLVDQHVNKNRKENKNDHRSNNS